MAANILFFDEELAASHINRIANTGIDDWWQSAHVKAATEEFLQQYSKRVLKPVNEISHLIRERLG
jgi:hypothetical protein